VSARRLADLLLFISGVGAAFQRVIRDRKRRRRGGRAAADATPHPGAAGADAAAAAASGPAEAGPVSAPAPTRGDEGWRTTEPALSAVPEFEIDVEVADAAEGAAVARGAGVEGALAALLASEPSSPARAWAMARLAEQPAEAIPALCAALPGPIEAEENTDPAALGPVPAALAALGPAAVPALLGALQDPDAARRRTAAVLLGAAGEPAAFAPLADRALDPDPRAAAAAAAALAANRRHPAMRPVPEKLRRALLSGIAARATGAARALGALRDVEAVPLLVQVLESSDRAPAAAAADALERITLQRLGTDARRWLGWWKENRGRGRAEWLFSGLTSPEREVRVAAAAELAAAAPPPVTYSPDGSAAEREGAARAWAGWWAMSGRVL
jgi:HEAT repeat protein